MKTSLKMLVRIVFLGFAVLSCNQEKQKINPTPSQEDQSEIARLEKETGVTFFKKDVVFTSHGNTALLRLATKNKAIFNHVIENLEIEIKPIYTQDITTSGMTTKPKDAVNYNLGEEIITEFIKMERGKDVIGFTTNFHLKKVNQLPAGKTTLTGYPYYVTHYSNNWPSNFYISFGSSGGGIAFQARRKWYNGWESDTNCITGSSFGIGIGECSTEFDLPGSSTYIVDVDGPWKSRVTIGTYDSNWTWGYTY